MMDVEKFHQRLNELYLPPVGEFTLVDVPIIRYGMIDGAGDPESAGINEAAKWLYSLVHVVKPYLKERMGKEFAEPPLEYLFWADNQQDFLDGKKDAWRWRVMVVFTDWISQDRFDQAVTAVSARLGSPPETLRMEDYQEGTCVQIQYRGNYDGIRAVCDQLYTIYLPENGLEPRGHYHEIYLNDPSRTSPEKRRIVIRQPVR